MTKAEWDSHQCARSMLARLHEEQPRFFRSQMRQLHRFLIDCCWKHQHLIPQEGLRNGLRGAERWIAGGIGDDELNELDWFAEAEAFAIDYAKSAEEISAIKSMVDGIEEIRDLPFDEARKMLCEAAYFAEGSIIYPRLSSPPWCDRLFISQFLCPDILREHIKPNLDPL